jgi:predicted NAD/FAD-binding protein
MPAPTTPRIIAVIGSGISGLGAAWLLSRRHRVVLFERDARLGGHTCTVDVDTPQGPLALDTGFLVHNPRTYPNLVRLFQETGVATGESDMSFSVSCRRTGFEYSSRGARGFFAQPRNAARPSHLRMFADIVRFNREAPAVLDAPGDQTLGEYLDGRGYSAGFVARYLVPMTSAIWSAPTASVRRMPVRTLVRFFQNHGMLAVGSHPAWRVVGGGSRTYIDKLTAPLDGRVYTSAEVVSVRRERAGVTLAFAHGAEFRADDVVFACHGDQILPMLADASPAERDVLSAFTTTANDAWLHTDARLLPVSPWARASWNYRVSDDEEAPPSVTYHLNRLQRLSAEAEYCVTLNPRETIDERRVIQRFSFRHPRFTREAIRAQERWREISGVNRAHFCGAYWRYGFHEDGFMSAIRVAADFGVSW